MKYFLNAEERKATGSTCFHEFYKGKWNEMLFWNEDSIYISDDMMFDLELDTLISSVVNEYDPCSETEINELQWKEIKSKAKETGGCLFDAIVEITSWVENNYRIHKVFTILGI